MASSRLQKAVRRVGEVFGRYRIEGSIAVCRCSSCVSPEIEAELVATPVGEITLQALAEYTHSAHPMIPRVADELRALLPRYAEFLAQWCWPTHFSGPTLALDRLAAAEWRSWPRDEVEALDEYFSALFEAALTDPASEPFVDIEELLLMLVRAGSDVPRLIAQWHRTPGTLAAERIAELAEGVQVRVGYWRLGSAHWQDCAEGELLLARWLASAHSLAKLDEALLASNNPETLERLLAARELLMHLAER